MTYITFTKDQAAWTANSASLVLTSTGSPVTLSTNDGTSGTFKLEDIPDYSGLTEGATTTGVSASVTPDVPGTYQFSFTVGGVEVDRRDLIVANNAGFMIPGFKSTSATFRPDGTSIKGYKTAVNRILASVMAPARVKVITGSYSVQLTDDVIAADTTSNVLTASLPSAPPFGTKFTVKDYIGSSSANPITVNIQGGGSTKIDGQPILIISQSYASYNFVYVTGSVNQYSLI